MKYLILFLFPLSVFAQTISPGQWESESAIKLNGLPLPSKTDKNCVSAAESKNLKKSIEKALKRNDCGLLNWKLKDKTISASVQCKNKSYDAEGSITGTYDKKAYALEGEISGQHHVLGNAKATVKLNGKWIGVCPKK